MKTKKLDKMTVTYRFKVDILRLPENKELSLVEKKDLWFEFLLAMAAIKKITYTQATKWVYPENELK